jgi:hypothetical protein
MLPWLLPQNRLTLAARERKARAVRVTRLDFMATYFEEKILLYVVLSRNKISGLNTNNTSYFKSI